MEDEKHKTILLIVVAINVVGACLTVISGRMMQLLWHQLLERESLPFVTAITLTAIMIWPPTIAIVSIILFVLSFKIERSKILNATLIMLIIEVILYFLSLTGFILPLLKGTKAIS